LSALAFKPAKANAPLVDLLESLGAVVIAKTNIPRQYLCRSRPLTRA
jgi:Asp-tRNA(Asn)/Glu-tRNA(Gln) amidotransferase A subunit family amidase